MARGGVAFSRGSGVSDGFVEAFFFGAGDFSAVPVFFFFFPLGDGSLVADFFGVGFALCSGVSLGLAEASDSFDGDFFFLGEDGGDGDFFLCADVFGFAVGVGVSSSEFTACARRIGIVFSSVCCAWRTKVPMIALSARKLQTPNRPTAAQRNRLFRPINSRTRLRGLRSYFSCPNFFVTFALAPKNGVQFSAQKQK